MEIEVKELEQCKLAVKYTADASEILDKRAEVLNQFKKAPVPGFRAGKASIEVVKIHYRSQIEEALKRALAEDAYHNTIFEKNIRPHGPPAFNTTQLADGKFICEFEMYSKPNFELSQYKNLEIPKPHEEMSEAALAEKMLQDLRIRFGEAAPYTQDDYVQAGDNIILNYEAFLDGEKVDSLSSEGEMLSIGASESALNFESNLYGMKLDELREFDFAVPADGLPSFAGKTIHVKATLVMGSKITPNPLDDSLAQKLNMKSLDDLRLYIRGNASSTMQNAFKNKVTKAVAALLVQNTSIDVPLWMSLSEAKYLTHSNKMDWDLLVDEDKEKFLEMAVKNVKLSLILDRIRECEPEAQISDQEVFDLIKQNVAKTKVDQPIDEIMSQLSRSGYLQILFSRVRDEYTMDFITKTVTYIE